MKMQRGNLELALHRAINTQEKHEKRFQWTHGCHQESALLAGWKEILKALTNGEPVEIV